MARGAFSYASDLPPAKNQAIFSASASAAISVTANVCIATAAISYSLGFTKVQPDADKQAAQEAAAKKAALKA